MDEFRNVTELLEFLNIALRGGTTNGVVVIVGASSFLVDTVEDPGSDKESVDPVDNGWNC
jgi:hypothetical protein